MTRKYYSMTSGGDSGKGAESFESYMRNARNDFSKAITGWFPHESEFAEVSELDYKRMRKAIRVAAEDLLICFDQMREKILQPTPPKEGVDQAAEGMAEKLYQTTPESNEIHRMNVAADRKIFTTGFLAGATWQAGQDRGEQQLAAKDKELSEAREEIEKQSIIEFIPWFLSPDSIATNDPNELYNQYVQFKSKHINPQSSP